MQYAKLFVKARMESCVTRGSRPGRDLRRKRGGRNACPKYPKIAGTASPLRLRRSEGPKLPPGRTGSFTSGSRWIQLSRRYGHDLSTHPDSAGDGEFVSGKNWKISHSFGRSSLG